MTPNENEFDTAGIVFSFVSAFKRNMRASSARRRRRPKENAQMDLPAYLFRGQLERQDDLG
jgi:hypothetical protein